MSNKKYTTGTLFILIFLLSMPLVVSVVSMVHLWTFFLLGNNYPLAVALAISFELASISGFLSLSAIKKIKSWGIWTVFVMLAFLQIVGNIYSMYDYLTISYQQNPNLLVSLKELLDVVVYDNTIQNTKLIYSGIIGIIIPSISLLMLKASVNIITSNDDVVEDTATINDTPYVDNENFIEVTTEQENTNEQIKTPAEEQNEIIETTENEEKVDDTVSEEIEEEKKNSI